MTDTSSSGGVPSPVVCPLAKLGRLSPTSVRLAYTNGGGAGTGGDSGFDGSVGCVSSSLVYRNRRPFKTTNGGDFSSELSIDYKKLSPSEQALCGGGDCGSGSGSDGNGRCCPNGISYSPAFRYQQSYRDYNINTCNKSSSAMRQFYTNQVQDGDENEFFRATSLKCHAIDRSSPYLDQGKANYYYLVGQIFASCYAFKIY